MSKVSNPFSTGGGGPTFEIRVQASFIATMLVHGAFPCLPQGEVEFIRLQARQAGYHTDDFVLSLTTPEGTPYKLLAQIKHQITFSASNDIFKDVLTDCWKDFNNPALFNSQHDSIALITGPLSIVVTNHVRPILNWAKHCRNASEFIGKVETSEFSSKQKRHYLAEIRKILDEADDCPVTDDQLWEFLCVVYLLGYDYDQAESSHLNLLFSMLKLAHNPRNPESVEALWGQIISYTQEVDQNAATVTLHSIPVNITCWFRKHERITAAASIQRLAQHGNPIINTIFDTIVYDIHIDRSELVHQILDFMNTEDVMIIAGNAGVGKSAIVKNLRNYLGTQPNF